MSILPASGGALSSILLGSKSGLFVKGRSGSNSVETLLQGLEATQPEKGKALRAHQEQLKNVLTQLESSRTNAESERKEAAKQKIERLKAQIRALKMLAGGDPKVVARQAARLAQELSAAVREYSGAGGSGGVFSAGDTTPTITAAPAAGASGGAQAQAVASQAQADASSAGAETAVASGGEASANADAQAAKSEAEQAAQDAKNAEQAEESPLALSREEIDEQISGMKQNLAASQADQEFATEARQLMNDLKNIIKNAKLKLQREAKQANNMDIAQAEKALRETEQAIGEIISGSMPISAPASVSVNILT
jgi:hypothetical protein